MKATHILILSRDGMPVSRHEVCILPSEVADVINILRSSQAVKFTVRTPTGWIGISPKDYGGFELKELAPTNL